MKADKISASRLQQYIRCPFEYYLSRHTDANPVKIFSDDSAMHIGNIVHKTLEKLRLKPDEDIVVDLLTKTNIQYDDYTLSDNQFQEVKQLLKKWVKTRNFSAEVVATEEYFSIPVRDFKLTGIIDLVERVDDDYYRVIDYKTGWAYKHWKNRMDAMQLKLYTLAVMEKYDTQNVDVAYDQIRFKSPSFHRYEKNELIEFIQYVNSIKKKIDDNEKPEPQMGGHCGWCDYFHHCDAFQEQIKMTDLEGLKLKDLGRKYEEVRGKIKLYENIKKSIKQSITERMDKGNRDTYTEDGVTVSMRQSTYRNYRPSVVNRIVDLDDEKLDKVTKVKKSALKDLDLPEEKMEEIEAEADISYSKAYIRIDDDGD